MFLDDKKLFLSWCLLCFWIYTLGTSIPAVIDYFIDGTFDMKLSYFIIANVCGISVAIYAIIRYRRLKNSEEIIEDYYESK